MQVFKTTDSSISKYVHNDGSETTIKTQDFNSGAKNKFSVFLSSSVGCPIGCKFCYLSDKSKFKYKKLSTESILNNAREAIEAEVIDKPELRKKYIKISWMGMGDALLIRPVDFKVLNEQLVDWTISDAGYAWGLDGIDVSTILPDVHRGWPHQLSNLNDLCNYKYRLNPNNKDKSPLRLFYSMNFTEKRHDHIPTRDADDPGWDLEFLGSISDWYGIDVILHHLFLNGVNDTPEDIINLKDVLYGVRPISELRILRYNKYPGSSYEESKKFDSIVESLQRDVGSKVRCQVSLGSEIKSACGMFMTEEDLT